MRVPIDPRAALFPGPALNFGDQRTSCPGWTKLDDNPAAVAITVSNGS